jgi:uncharacterized protein YbjT (DUF2867 family)
MKRVLVTGGTGFIGRQALPFLIKRGYEVHAVTSRSALAGSAALKWHHADLFNDDQTRALMIGVSACVPSRRHHAVRQRLTEPARMRYRKRFAASAQKED